MRSTELVLLATLVAACESGSPPSLVICHNANCAEPADPERDDTIEALRESLDLPLQRGLPVFDGVELDTFFRAADSTCLYAHDLDRDQTPALEPTGVLAEYFARPGQLGHGDTFYVAIELKSHVSADKTDTHDAAQLAAHATCAWEVYRAIADAAVANDRAVVMIFEAFNPELLRAVIAATPATLPIPVEYSAIQGVPAPLDNQTRELGDFAGLPLTYVEFHAQWILDAQYELVRSLGADLAVFMFSATAETFSAIEQYRPRLIYTSEATLLRRWLDR